MAGAASHSLFRSSRKDPDPWVPIVASVRVKGEYDYRNAKAILRSQRPEVLDNIYDLLNSETFHVRLGAAEGKTQDISKQIQRYFVSHGWEQEKKMVTLPDLRYDLMKQGVPIEVEIGHERLVYADFLKFLADYAHRKIEAGVMMVTHNPKDFGHTWHNSTENTKRKIEAISTVLLVPILVLGIAP